MKQGFSLNEVVIVVVVILLAAPFASKIFGYFVPIKICSGPGRNSATKGQMAYLKTALMNYSADLGSYPHAGKDKYNGASYGVTDGANGFSANLCCLASSTIVTVGWDNLGLATSTYNRRWKGPYMDSDPKEFLTDVWGNGMKYGVYDKMIFFHSSGEDGFFDNAIDIIKDRHTYLDDGGDDILVIMARVRKSFGTTVFQGVPNGC